MSSFPIGIVGCGVSALHLGLDLVTNDVDATIYTPLTADAIAVGKMQNTVAHMPDTVQRERRLSVDFWDEDSVRTCRVRHYSLLVGEGHGRDFSVTRRNRRITDGNTRWSLHGSSI